MRITCVRHCRGDECTATVCVFIGCRLFTYTLFTYTYIMPLLLHTSVFTAHQINKGCSSALINIRSYNSEVLCFVRIHREPTSPVSALTARFDPSWTVVVDARVAACVLRIGGINMASNTGNNVGTSPSFKEI